VFELFLQNTLDVLGVSWAAALCQDTSTHERECEHAYALMNGHVSTCALMEEHDTSSAPEPVRACQHQQVLYISVNHALKHSVLQAARRGIAITASSNHGTWSG
jgi:hypothetical protein